MQWRSPVFRTFCFQRSAKAASFTSVCVSRQTVLLGTSGLMISFRASGIVPQLSAVRTPICPFENCIQSWTERLAPFGQSVLHLRWNFGVCGAMHNASSLHASIPHVCYHPQLGPVQTCDTCMVEADGPLLRACATRVADGSEGAPSERVTNNLAAQKEPSAINHPRPGAL